MAKETAADLPQTSRAHSDPTEAALHYLQKAYAEERGVAVIMGLSSVDNTSVVRRFLRTAPIASTAHIAIPSDSPHAFMEAILSQLGFEPFDSSVADLQNLIGVYLRHELAQGRRTVIALESTQDCGPRVLDVIQELAQIDQNGVPAALLVLTGSADLTRVLDSTRMMALSARIDDRFTNNVPITPAVPRDSEVVSGHVQLAGIEVTHEGRKVLNRALDNTQVLIGRSEYNDVSLDSRFVSRHHAFLVNQPDGAYIVDLKSTNGTFVNSTRIEHQSLKHGDVINVGNFRLTYLNPQRKRPAHMIDEDDAGFADTMVMQSLSGETFDP